MQRVWHASRDADSSGHLVPSLWDLHVFYLLTPILFRTCRYFTGLCSSNISRYFFDFALPFSRFRYAFLWPLRWLLVYGQDFIHIFKMYMSICTTSVWNGKIGSFTILTHKLRRFLLQHRPSQIVCNRGVIQRLGDTIVLILTQSFLRIFCWYRGLCHMTGSDILSYIPSHYLNWIQRL